MMGLNGGVEEMERTVIERGLLRVSGLQLGCESNCLQLVCYTSSVSVIAVTSARECSSKGEA